MATPTHPHRELDTMAAVYPDVDMHHYGHGSEYDYDHAHHGSVGGLSPQSAPALGSLVIGDTPTTSTTTSNTATTTTTTTTRAHENETKDEAPDTPQWSEMKTKAGKERKRLPLACIACRRKKIRCSGEKPACKHCLRSRIPCVYKVTTRKAAPRTDYMAMLDKRLKRMEDRVIRLIPAHSLPALANVGRSLVKPPLPGAVPKTPTAVSTATKKRPADDAFATELDDWSRTTGADADPAQRASRANDARDGSLLTEGADSLPAKDLQEHLAEVYFDYVYGQSYPLLHKPSFMRRLAAGKVPPVLILAMCAISARFSTHPNLRTEPCFLRGDDWAARARDIALKRYDTPNITILIVYLLLGLHEFGTCQGGRSWMFGGMAQRMAYALQLHKENEYDPLVTDPDKKPLSATDREIRRRTMWSCFLMDRFNSSGTDRPLFVHEQYVEVQLPIKEHLYIHDIHAPTENLEGNVPNPVPPDGGQLANARDNMGVSAYTIRLVCTWGKLIKFMNLGGKERETHPMWSSHSTYHAIKREAHEFKASLPAMLVYSPENLKSHAIGKTANSFLYLHILWQQIMLFMHRFALPSTAGSRPPKDMPHDFLTESARAALDAANQISILINEAMDHNVVAPFAGYSAFFSSTVHVHGVFSKNPKLETQSKKYLAYNVKYLTKMKKYWGMFHYIAENLKELYRQHADAQLQGPASSGHKKKGSIFQYGDWFDRYPHGVSKTDYEDAAESNVNEPGTDAVLGQKSDLQSVEEFFASLSPPTKTEQTRKQARRNKSKSVSKLNLNTSHADTSSHVPRPLHQAQSVHSSKQQLQQQLQQQQQQQIQQRHQEQQQQQQQLILERQQHQQHQLQQQQQHQHQQPPPPQHIAHMEMPSHDAIEAAIAAGYDPTTLFTTPHAPQHHLSPQQQQYLLSYSPQHNSHPSLPILSPSPSTLLHHPHQMDLTSPFPDLTAAFTNVANFWDFDPLTGLSTHSTNPNTTTSTTTINAATSSTSTSPTNTAFPGPGSGPTNNNNNNVNTFFDPMSSYFVPFNVAPPLFTTTDDDGAAGGSGGGGGGGGGGPFAHAHRADAYGFALGAGTPVDLDLLHGGNNGGGTGTSHGGAYGEE